MKTILTAFLLSLASSIYGADEVPPFYPSPQPQAPYGSSTIAPADIQVTLPDKTLLKPGLFNREYSLDGIWKLSRLKRSAAPFLDEVDLDKGYEEASFDDSKWNDIAVPLNWYKSHPEVYEKNESYVTGTYRKKFNLSEEDLKKGRILLHFGVIGYDGTVFVNGQKVGRHKGDFTPCEFDITPYAKIGINQLTVRVLTDFGPSLGKVPLAKHVYGSQWNWDNIKGGIWQPVVLKFRSDIHFQSLLITPEFATQSVRVDYTINNTTGETANMNLGFAVTTALKSGSNQLNVATDIGTMSLKPGINKGTATVKLDHPINWSLDNPFLYYLTGYLKNEKRIASADAVRFGFREFTIKNGNFYLNGERIYLFGENLSSVGFGGQGRSSEEERKLLHDSLTGFKSLGVRIVRTAHMPIVPEALDIADEIGLMIFDEWGWCFTNKIDENAFRDNNDRELVEWLTRDYNHPSVVMWDGGNEIRHKDNPEVKRQLDRQVDSIRSFDKSARPVGSFSGSASWASYGTDPLNTDFLDLHSYGGLSKPSWTDLEGSLEKMYDGSLKQYKRPDNEIGMPYIVWECVGFSWGEKYDPSFKLNDIDSYAKYARASTSWGQPNGIGFAGTIGLAAALDPKRGMKYGRALFGHRILELIRQDPRVDGFAPWFHDSNLSAATLWNQPIFPGIRDAAGLPPSNLFAEDIFKAEIYVANSTDRLVKDAVFHIWLEMPEGKRLELGTFKAGPIAPWQIATIPVEIKISKVPTPHVQMRVLLSGPDGRELGRNFYNMSVRDKDILTTPVKTAEKTVLLNVGDDADVQTTGAVLKALKISFEVLPASQLSSAYTMAIIPAGLHNPNRLNVNSETLLDWVRKGGKLLILEQNSVVQNVLPYSRVVSAEMPYADLVIPEHPAFKNLDQRDFDQWNNPDKGFVLSASIAPFTINALAVRGPHLGAPNVENAVMEAKVGDGRIFWNQLNAIKLWGVDSAASLYLRNVLDYMLGGGKPFAKIRPLDARASVFFNIPAGQEVFVDLSKAANQGFADDGKGNGWTDQGVNDFGNMPVGLQQVNGVPFKIIDPAKNGGKSCVVLRGTDRPKFPARADGLQVDKQLTRIFFLHACAWSGDDVGLYRIHYEDGSHIDYALVNGRNIGDWWGCAFLTDAFPGIIRENGLAGQVGIYMAVWENPHPEKTITTIDFLSARADNTIDFLPGHAPVPILVAITGELYNPHPLQIIPAGQTVVWHPGARNGVDKPEITTETDPQFGEVSKIAFPAVSGDGVAYAFCTFPADDFNLDKFNYLTFMAKVDKPGALDISIPEKDWRRNMSASVHLDSRYAEWHKVRLNLRGEMKGDGFKNSKARGELFFYNGNNRSFMFPRSALNLYITNVQYE